MEQLPLQIVPRLNYSPESFVIHSGIESIYSEVLLGINSQKFFLKYIVAGSRQGKTHFSIKLADQVSSSGNLVSLYSGFELEEKLNNPQKVFTDNLIIVDDIHSYLTKITPGNSAAFVNLVETVKAHSGGLVLLSDRGINNLPCDAHITSRLRQGIGLAFGNPNESELKEILHKMAYQRGIKLKERNIGFIMRKIGRDIPTLEYYLERLIHLSQVLGKNIKPRLISDAVC